MARRTSALLVASWLTVPGLAMAEEELTPQKLAEIRRDEQAAQAKVNAAYGNRKPSEMSTEERRQAAKDQQEAGLAVLEKHGVSDKEYSRHVARMDREEREAVAQAEKKLDDEAKAAQAAKAAKEAEKKRIEEEGLPADEIPVQQGFSDDNPVVLESTGEDQVEVEEGLPAGDATSPVVEQAPAAPTHARARGKRGKRK